MDIKMEKRGNCSVFRIFNITPKSEEMRRKTASYSNIAGILNS
jgi:hypothetical protein